MAKNKEISFSEGVKKMTSDEIGAELKGLRERLYTLRSQSVTEKVEDHSQFGITKRNIARLLTEQSFRRIHGETKPQTHAAKAAKRAPRPAKKVAKKVGKVAKSHSHARPVRKKATKGVKAAPSRKATKAKTKATTKAKAGK